MLTSIVFLSTRSFFFFNSSGSSSISSERHPSGPTKSRKDWPASSGKSHARNQHWNTSVPGPLQRAALYYSRTQCLPPLRVESYCLTSVNLSIYTFHALIIRYEPNFVKRKLCNLQKIDYTVIINKVDFVSVFMPFVNNRNFDNLR